VELGTLLDWTGGPALLWVIFAAALYWLGRWRARRPARGPIVGEHLPSRRGWYHQQLAAGVMWVSGSVAYTIAIILIAYRWLEPRGTRRARGASAKVLPTGVG
jgi:cytochrome c oxidase assembly factor CtaG